MQKSSLKDIAQKAGVSTALVSYVLNGKQKEMHIKSETAIRIKEIASELNYRPNIIAQSLRSGSTKTFGLIVSDIANSYFGQLVRVIENEASKHGYKVIIGSSDEDSIKMELLIETMKSRQVDGFFIVPTQNSKDIIEALKLQKQNVVLLDRIIEGVHVSSVSVNNYKSVHSITEKLIQAGYRNIAYVTYTTNLSNISERLNGYETAIKKHSLGLNIIQISSNNIDRVEIENKIIQHEAQLKQADSVIFATNTLSLAGMYVFQRLNIEIPTELAVIGYDGHEAFDLFYCPISYISQPVVDIGSKAVDIMIKLQSIDIEQNIQCETSFVLQSSSPLV